MMAAEEHYDSRATTDVRRPTYILKIVPDALTPDWHQAISNRKVDWTVTIMKTIRIAHTYRQQTFRRIREVDSRLVSLSLAGPSLHCSF